NRPIFHFHWPVSHFRFPVSRLTFHFSRLPRREGGWNVMRFPLSSQERGPGGEFTAAAALSALASEAFVCSSPSVLVFLVAASSPVPEVFPVPGRPAVRVRRVVTILGRQSDDLAGQTFIGDDLERPTISPRAIPIAITVDVPERPDAIHVV